MAQQISEYLALLEDKEAPPNPKPLLQQYDNYQIYDLYFSTVNYKSTKTYPDGSSFFDKNFTVSSQLVAVQHYSATKPLCDFQQIAETYI